MLKLNINFSLQKQLKKNSDPTDSTQLNFVSAQNVIEKASDRNHSMELFSKKGKWQLLEMIGQRDTRSNNLEKPSSEPC